MNILNHSVCYLIGPIDKVADGGTTWRKKFVKLIKEKDINLNIIDPTNKPGDYGSETQKEKDTTNRLKEEGKWDELTAFSKQFRLLDLRYVAYVDFVVAYIDSNVHMFGSIDEILTAENQNKPIFIICPHGKANMSNWAFTVASWKEMFDTVEDCVEHIVKINSGEIELDDRWVLIRRYINKK